MCMHVCVLDREGSRVVASRALVVVQTSVYPTGYRDCLTGFHEPLLLPKWCHISLKTVKANHQTKQNVKTKQTLTLLLSPQQQVVCSQSRWAGTLCWSNSTRTATGQGWERHGKETDLRYMLKWFSRAGKFCRPITNCSITFTKNMRSWDMEIHGMT